MAKGQRNIKSSKSENITTSPKSNLEILASNSLRIGAGIFFALSGIAMLFRGIEFPSLVGLISSLIAILKIKGET